MNISHLFFELPQILIDSKVLRSSWIRELGLVMASRYGGNAVQWSQAQQAIINDWDSYYHDLDLGGDEGLHDMWEGLYRTTHALFRITHVPEPEKSELITLSRELPGLVAAQCNALYPDVPSVLQQLYQWGYVLGVTSHMPTNKASGLLRGGGVADCCAGPIIGPDMAGHFLKDRAFYAVALKQAGVQPTACLVVDSNLADLRSAHAAGLVTAYYDRTKALSHGDTDVDFTLTNGLADLLPPLGKV